MVRAECSWPVLVLKTRFKKGFKLPVTLLCPSSCAQILCEELISKVKEQTKRSDIRPKMFRLVRPRCLECYSRYRYLLVFKVRRLPLGNGLHRFYHVAHGDSTSWALRIESGSFLKSLTCIREEPLGASTQSTLLRRRVSLKSRGLAKVFCHTLF